MTTAKKIAIELSDTVKKNFVLSVPVASLKKWRKQADRKQLSRWIRTVLNAVAEGRIPVRFAPEKITRGAFASEIEKTARLQFRVDTAEISAWKKSAKKNGLSTAEWIRQAVDWCAV